MNIETEHHFPTMESVMEDAQRDLLKPKDEEIKKLSLMQEDPTLRILIFPTSTFRYLKSSINSYFDEKYPDGFDSKSSENEKNLIRFGQRLINGEPLGAMPSVGKRPSSYAINVTGPECVAAFWFVHEFGQDFIKPQNKRPFIDNSKKKLLRYSEAPLARPKIVESSLQKGRKFLRGFRDNFKRKI